MQSALGFDSGASRNLVARRPTSPSVTGRLTRIPGTLTAVSWIPPKRLSRRAWRAVGDALSRIRSAIEWALGDWLRHGIGRGYIGRDRYDAAEDATGYDRQRLWKFASVAREFESWRRHPDLKWEHHRTVAGLPPLRQDRLLRLAARNGWTRERLRAEARRNVPTIVPKPRRTFNADLVDVRVGDCRRLLNDVPEKSVHCVPTSPPWFGKLRYDGPRLAWGGNADCRHQWNTESFCTRCDAWLGRLGNEPDVALYVQHLVEMFRPVHRVLRDDGLLVLHVGETFDGHALSIPSRIELAMVDDVGFRLVQEVIVTQRNAMPASVKCRLTQDHTTLLILSKTANYFFDPFPIREPSGTKPDATRHPRSFWFITKENDPQGKHPAPSPREVVRRAILCGTSEKGCCQKCGAPYDRDVVYKRYADHVTTATPTRKTYASQTGSAHDVRNGMYTEAMTRGWKPRCSCNAPVVPCVVLDPCAGQGTVGLVAQEYGRRALLMEVSASYLRSRRKEARR